MGDGVAWVTDTGSLDERSVDLVLGLFSRLPAERPGMSLIIVTHDIPASSRADHQNSSF